MKLTISPGNSKIGRIPNVSFLPVVTCANNVPCREKCYACGSVTAYAKSVIPAWGQNTMLYVLQPAKFWSELHAWFDVRRAMGRPQYFRWFVGGDIPDFRTGEAALFVDNMVGLAALNPQTIFRSWTKRTSAMERYLELRGRGHSVKNLQIGWSVWPGHIPEVSSEYSFHNISLGIYKPKVKIVDPVADRLSRGARTCPGGCSNCKLCWGTKRVKVIFNEH